MNPAEEASPRRMLWAMRQKALRAARGDLSRFGALVARRPDGRPLEFSLEHLAWIAHVDYCWSRGLHAGVFGAGGSGFLVTLAAWLLGREREARVGLACASDRHAAMRMKAVRSILASPRFELVFPGGAGPLHWEAGFALPGPDATEPRVEVRGAQARPVTTSFTHLLFDNVTDAASVATSQRRDSQKTAVEGWLAALEAGGRGLWISRAWSPDDVSYALRDRRDFCWLEQRPGEGGEPPSQEVHGAGEDYLDVVGPRLRELVSGG